MDAHHGARRQQDCTGAQKGHDTVDVIKLIASASPRVRARIAGILYLIIFIAAPSGAKNATLAKIAITMACDTGVALLFYNLFKPVNKNLSLLAVVFRLVFVAVMTVNSLDYFGLWNLFKSAHSSAAFNAGYGIALVPFGIHCVAIGFLIFHSTFMPRIIGILMAVAGLGYLTFVWPPLGDHLFVPYILVPGLIGEGSLTLWLIFVGVNSERWMQQASAAGQAPSSSAIDESRDR
jgi:Domain of unknown function (DUF4386)